MLFIVHNPEAKNFFFFQLGLKYRQSLNTLLKTNVIENNPSTKLTESDTNGFCSMQEILAQLFCSKCRRRQSSIESTKNVVHH